MKFTLKSVFFAIEIFDDKNEIFCKNFKIFHFFVVVNETFLQNSFIIYQKAFWFLVELVDFFSYIHTHLCC